MTLLEIAVNGASLAAAIGGVSYVAWVVKASGADRSPEPARVRRVIETAPYERISNVIAKLR